MKLLQYCVYYVIAIAITFTGISLLGNLNTANLYFAVLFLVIPLLVPVLIMVFNTKSKEKIKDIWLSLKAFTTTGLLASIIWYSLSIRSDDRGGYGFELVVFYFLAYTVASLIIALVCIGILKIKKQS